MFKSKCKFNKEEIYDVRIFEVFLNPLPLSEFYLLSTDPFLISSNFLDPLPPKTENSLQFYNVRYHINLNNSQNAINAETLKYTFRFMIVAQNTYVLMWVFFNLCTFSKIYILIENRLFLQLGKVPIPQSLFFSDTIDNRIFNYLLMVFTRNHFRNKYRGVSFFFFTKNRILKTS